MCPIFSSNYLFQPRCLSFPSERPTGPCRPHRPGCQFAGAQWHPTPVGCDQRDQKVLIPAVTTTDIARWPSGSLQLCWFKWVGAPSLPVHGVETQVKNNIVVQSSILNTETPSLLQRQSRCSEQFWIPKLAIPIFPIAAPLAGSGAATGITRGSYSCVAANDLIQSTIKILTNRVDGNKDWKNLTRRKLDNVLLQLMAL